MPSDPPGSNAAPVPASPVDPTAGDLARARDVLNAAPARLDAAPARLDAAPARLDAEHLRDALVDLHEFWLVSRAAELGIRAGSGMAIVAVGGLGRRELLPYSDLDLVLVHDGKQGEHLADTADALWYPLWDAHIALDHSVRTPDQAVKVAAEDLTAALGMLEARHIAGDTTVSTALIAGSRAQWRNQIRTRFDELVEQAAQRWDRCGDVAHRVEPDLKHGRGGLRDLQLLDALAAAQLTDRMPGFAVGAPGGGLPGAHKALLDVRTELHRAAGRARDVLRAQDADEIGAALAVGDRFDLARMLSDAARTVGFSVEVSLRTARAALPRRGLSALRRGPVRRPLDSGVVEHAGEVVLAREATPTKDPALVLRVAATSARTGLPIGAGTLARLADSAPELRTPWPREALEELVALLGSGRRLIPTVEALDRSGLWGRLLPEWGAVRDLPPRDAAHTWTVDRHLVETAVHAGALTTRVSRPDLLVLGALLHDIGKGRGGDHSVVGAELVEQIGTRMGLWRCDVALLGAMVRHHLLLPATATRRDLDDPETITGVVQALGGDAVLLELLHALCEADSLATGPGVWGDWKAGLVADLVARCRLVTAGEQLPGPEPVSAEHQRLAVDGGLHVQLATAPRGADLTVTVVSPDVVGLLSRSAGVLALHSLRVHSASARTHAGSAVITFGASPRFGDPPAAALLRQDLARALAGNLDLGARLAAKEKDYGEGAPAPDRAPPRVIWVEDTAAGAVVLELRTGDRTGLLHTVGRVLEDHGARLRWARVTTLGASVVDVFALDLGAGDGPDRRRGLEAAVLAAVRSSPDMSGGSA
ncbi:MAG: [protein-PII] uridylyltransferase [Mycobacteriaceae bacterium]